MAGDDTSFMFVNWRIVYLVTWVIIKKYSIHTKQIGFSLTKAYDNNLVS